VLCDGCGSSLMVESAAKLLFQIDIPPVCIRAERFGPTGGSQ